MPACREQRMDMEEDGWEWTVWSVEGPSPPVSTNISLLSFLEILFLFFPFHLIGLAVWPGTTPQKCQLLIKPSAQKVRTVAVL